VSIMIVSMTVKLSWTWSWISCNVCMSQSILVNISCRASPNYNQLISSLRYAI